MQGCYKKRSQSNSLSNNLHLNTTLEVKKSSSNSVIVCNKDGGCLHGDDKAVLNNSYDSRLSHKIDKDSSVAKNETLTIKQSIKDDRNINLNISVMCANTDFDDNSNSFTRIISMGVDGIPQDKNRDISIDSAREVVTNFGHLCCKFLTALAIIFVIGCFIMPLILYYISKTANAGVPVHPKLMINESSSRLKILKVCNVSVALYSDYMHQISYTYEALRTINFPLSQQYCTERVKTLFCDALMKCNNEPCVKDIMCQQVRQEYCTSEWRLLEADNQTDQLIDCKEYGETASLICGDQFGLMNNEYVCLPLCGKFSQYSEVYTMPHVVIIAASQFTSVVGGLIVVVASLWKKKKMLQFPQVLIVMNAGILVTINFLVIIPTVSIGRWNMLCSSKFLFEAVLNPTTFCKVQGCVITAGFVLYVYFWLLYASHLALKVLFPLKSSKFFDSDYCRMIYITEVTIIILISILPPIVSAALGKYSIVVFPPIYCLIQDQLYCLFVTIIPVLVGSCACIVLMILVLSKLHMHYGIFKRMQEESTGKQVCTCQFTVPEVKIVFVLVYWLVITTALFTSFSLKAGRTDMFYYYIKRYIDCMAGGHRKHLDCHSLRQDFETDVDPTLEIIYLIFVAFLNFSSIPFVIQYRTVKRLINRFSSSILTKLEIGSKSQTMQQQSQNS